jgi:hypothetical protein
MSWRVFAWGVLMGVAALWVYHWLERRKFLAGETAGDIVAKVHRLFGTPTDDGAPGTAGAVIGGADTGGCGCKS